jgi:WD40 repeat protein
VSCSLDRELRVWDIDSSTFIKKYDLASFTNEAVTSIKLLTQGMLLLGSKDSNIYMIDTLNGKLSIIYEGHWSRVNLIYILPQRDTMISVAESNIKVWDLEYDECIKNMNDHTSLVIYCQLCKKD